MSDGKEPVDQLNLLSDNVGGPLRETGVQVMMKTSNFVLQDVSFVSSEIPTTEELIILHSIEQQENIIGVIVDSGSSKPWMTPCLDDFVSAPIPVQEEIFGIASSLQVQGVGEVEWVLLDDNGHPVVIHSKAYYVPNLPVRLMSPQKYVRENGGSFLIEGEFMYWTLKDGTKFTLPYLEGVDLPVAWGYDRKSNLSCNAWVLDDANQNLTTSQKELLKWHCKLGHTSFKSIQALARRGFLPHKLANVDAPMCTACRYARAKKTPVPTATKIAIKTEHDVNSIKEGDLFPGQRVSLDHLESHLPGKLWSEQGRFLKDRHYIGGAIFVDHASGYMSLQLQESLNAAETVRSKHLFEREAYEYRVLIESYHTDNGIFSAKDFREALEKGQQSVRYCAVGAHHQNGVAERAIGTITEHARAMMLHAASSWPECVDSSLWPLVVKYAVYLWNHMPNPETGLAPIEIFSEVKSDYYELLSSHVWGCPVYVLDPALQGGVKLPRWRPRSRRGMFVGISDVHSSKVGLVMNLSTKNVSPQYHLVYDEWFTTVKSAEDIPPDNWEDLFIHHRERADYDYDVVTPKLDVEWMDNEEQREVQELEALRHKALAQGKHTDTSKSGEKESGKDLSHDFDLENEVQEFERIRSPMSFSPRHERFTPELPTIKEQIPKPAEVIAGVRRSNRVRKPPSRLIEHMDADSKTYQALYNELKGNTCFTAHLKTLQELLTNPRTKELDGMHPWTYTASMVDQDSPTYFEAMTGPDSEKYRQAMAIEIEELVAKGTWKLRERSSLPEGANVLPSTWAFKRKRNPSGIVTRYKARFCVRGDKQVKGIDCFDTYAPVVAWSTVRLMFILSLLLGLKSRQVDYNNAFVQAELNEEVFVELPKDFYAIGDDGSEENVVLQLIKSLYGLKQSPLKWFQKLCSGLKARGFKQSAIDPCLFLKDDIVCVVYVDDCLFFSPEESVIDNMVNDLKTEFDLEPEDDVAAFLGIKIEPKENGTIELKQPHLIERILNVTQMNNCHATATPANEKPIGKDEEGEPRIEEWHYGSVIGMLMWLCSNTRPDISYAVHQCARFTHVAKRKHEEAVKRICRYLKGTQDKGLILNPTSEMKLDCFVDADFAGLWGVEDPQDPVSVKSRTGYVITFAACPIVWVSKLQTEIALSTMEAEYIALSQSMRDLLPLRTLTVELLGTLHTEFEGTLTHSTVFEDNNGTIVLATAPQMTPRSKHIGIKYHFFREAVRTKEVHIERIDSENQKADIFTKGLTQEKFEKMRKLLMGW